MSHDLERDLILASTSVYRRALLERLGLAFRCVAPEVDESPRPDEDPEALARRLSAAKALKVSAIHPHSLVIGSDQVASIVSQLLTKPGDSATARAQLRHSSGRAVLFHTAVSLAQGEQILDQCCVPTEVRFRELTDAEITEYVARDEPLDCAGSFRWERLGIALFESLHSEDPTALEGLPLIATVRVLRSQGINVLDIAS